MKKLLCFLFPLTVLLLACGEKKRTVHVAFPWTVPDVVIDYSKNVDPMIGTDGHGHTFPGATAPFGMVQLSPDTRVDDSWDGCSGYHYSDSLIYGFSHTHLSGTGCSDYGDILLMPGTGTIHYTNGADGKPGYRSSFSHKNEHAEAGYYSVVLDKYNVKAELTASPRVGVHRYTYPKGSDAWVLLDLQHRDEVLGAHLEIVDEYTIRGYRFSKAWAGNQQLWFSAVFSKPITKHLFWSDGKTFEADSSSAKDLKASFSFDNSDTLPLTVCVALSPVSCENAAMNLQVEVPVQSFDLTKIKVQQNWNAELQKIRVKTLDERKDRVFYTALYHCFIAPNVYCDVNGDYRGMDHNVHTDTIHPQYSVFSLWDTYRALHPLFTLVQPERDQDFIHTFLKQYKEGGRLPVWELSANETDCMIGYHSVPVIVDAWMKGLTNFDTALAYEAMKHSAMSDERGLKAYKKFGFIPAEGESESVSQTLEYAYDDWCIALAAKRMKKEEDYNYFMRRAQSWRNLYDPQTGFMRARLNNAFVQPFDPNEVNFHYTEANAWQYSLAVQQDIPGLIAAHGGDEKFIVFLDQLFSASTQTSGREQADITGLIGQYAQGNEPSHHMAYLYDFTSQPWKTQQLVSKICDEQYKDTPDGLCGNEDCGQMSAWYVMSMLGLYDVSPGTDRFYFGTPGCQSAEIYTGTTAPLKISINLPLTASTLKPGGAYAKLKSVTLNGQEVTAPFITYSQIRRGGTLDFGLTGNEKEAVVFQQQADSSFAKMKWPLPPRVTATFVPEGKLPVLKRTFVSQMNVRMQSEGSVEVFASVNGSNFQSVPYLSFTGRNSEFSGYDLLLTDSATIRAFARDASRHESDTVTFHYNKIPEGRSIQLLSSYKPQYAAGGDIALIDGIRGPDNFRTGTWQGYEGNNIEAVIDLGSKKEISKMSMGFLQDQGAWIFMPEEVQYFISDDGKNFTPYATVSNTIDPKHDGPVLHDFSAQKTVTARYVKVIAKNRGNCPEWHPGKGHPAWIFADEIMIDAR